MSLPKHITNEQTGISYTLHGDFYFPDIKVAEEIISLGKWGNDAQIISRKTQKGSIQLSVYPR